MGVEGHFPQESGWLLDHEDDPAHQQFLELVRDAVLKKAQLSHGLYPYP